MEKIDKLQQLMKLIQNDTITPQEVEKFLLIVVESVKKAKDNFETISQETLTEVSDALRYIEAEHEKVITKTEDIVDSVTSTLDSRLKEVTQMIADLKEMKPKDGDDGKDADEEYIISEVLSRIELPEQKEFELDTGEDIVDKINLLPVTEEYQIDASHIKNLPEATGSRGGSTARNLRQLNDVTITSPTNGQGLVYNSTTGQWENDSGGGASIGGTITGGTAGSVLFVNPDGVIAQDNAGFFYDDSENTLRLTVDGSNEHVLDIKSTKVPISSTELIAPSSIFNPGTGFSAGVPSTAVYISSIDTIVLSGTFTGNYNGSSVTRIAAINTDGTISSTFLTGSGINSTVQSMYEMTDTTYGVLFVAGAFTSYNGTTVDSCIKLNSDGSLNTTFNNNVTSSGGMDGVTFQAAEQSDGKILIVGSFTTIQGVTKNKVARLNSDGTLDTSFDVGAGPDTLVTTSFTGISLESGGKIYITGAFSSFNGFKTSGCVRLNSDGSVDTTFACYATASSTSITPTRAIPQSDGGVILIGSFSNVNGTPVTNAAKLNSTGTLVTTHPATIFGINGSVNQAKLYSSAGDWWVAGEFTAAFGYPVGGFISVNGSGANTNFPISTFANAGIYGCIPAGDIFIVFGSFTTIQGQSFNRIAALVIPPSIRTRTIMEDASSDAVVSVNGYTNLATTVSGAEVAQQTISSLYNGADLHSLTLKNGATYSGINYATNYVTIGTTGKVTSAPLEMRVSAGGTSINYSANLIKVIADSDFSSSTGNWTGTNWTIAAGVATHTAGANAFTLAAAAINAAPVSSEALGGPTVFTLTFNVTTTVGGTLTVAYAGVSTATVFTVGSSGFSVISAATATTATIVITPDATWTGSIDAVSVTHAKSITPTIAIVDSGSTNRVSFEVRSWRQTNAGALAIGYNSLSRVTSTPSQVVCIGYKANETVAALSGSVCIGASSKSGGTDVVIGSRATNDTASGVVIGDTATNSNIYTVIIGNNATGTGDYGIGIGFQTRGATNGVSIGRAAGLGQTGLNNLFLGYQVANNTVTGSNNMGIGYDIDLPSTSASNQMTIGNLLFGTAIDGTGTTISTGSIGIGTNSPDRRFHTEVSDSVTNAVTYTTRYSHITSGTAAVGFGTGTEYELENASGTDRVAGTQEVIWSDATNSSEDSYIVRRTMLSGTLTESSRDLSTGGFLVPNGSASSPSMTFGAIDNGFYGNASTSIRVGIGGSHRWTLSATELASSTTGGVYMLRGASSATVPGYSFVGDENTGFGTSAADTIDAITGGASRFTVTSSGITLKGTTQRIQGGASSQNYLYFTNGGYDAGFYTGNVNAGVPNYGFTVGGLAEVITSGTSGAFRVNRNFGAAAGSGNWRPMSVEYTINNSGAQSGTATGIFLNATETALNSMTHNLMDLQTGGVSQLKLTSAGALTALGSVRSGTTATLGFNGRGGFLATGDGIIQLKNDANSDFNRLQFGGTTSSFPSIKRNGAALNFRLADDSADANITAASLALSGTITSGGSYIYFGSSGTRGSIHAISDGVFALKDFAETSFSRLQFGGTTSSFPALKRSSADLQFRLADDSAYSYADALGYKVSGAASSGKILKANGTAFVASTETYAAPGTSGNVMTSDGTNWTSAAPSGGAGSMTLLGSGSGSLTVTAGSSNIDTVAISGLTALDSLYIVYTFDATGSDDDGRWLLYQATTNDTIIRADNNSNLGGSYITGSATIRQNPQTDTTYNSIDTFYSGNLGSGATYGNTQGALTAWTGSWDLALRHTPAGTGSGTAYWTWAVYKVTGQ